MIEADCRLLADQIRQHLADQRAGERLRDGFLIALIGVPNAGKSSLINALVRRDVAIVSQIAGTTRDVVEAHVDVAGFPVVLADTAGLREKADSIESEGIRRAVRTAAHADLILHVADGRSWPAQPVLPAALADKQVVTVWNKADLMTTRPSGVVVSAKTGEGIADLWTLIRQVLERDFGQRETAPITRERYRAALTTCLNHLDQAAGIREPELKAEDLRLAARALGRITGQVDVEELLDIIFRDFCIGK